MIVYSYRKDKVEVNIQDKLLKKKNPRVKVSVRVIEPKPYYYSINPDDYNPIYNPINVLFEKNVFVTPEKAYYKYIKKNPDKLESLKKEQLLLILKYKTKQDVLKYKAMTKQTREEIYLYLKNEYF